MSGRYFNRKKRYVWTRLRHFLLAYIEETLFSRNGRDTIDDAITKLIVSGVTPSLPETIENSQDPAIVAMKPVMWKAMEYDMEKRPMANLLAQQLLSSLNHFAGQNMTKNRLLAFSS